jgi:GNAT superfamily N-acetyltransferase
MNTMARKLRITGPDSADIAELGYWRDLAGIRSENLAADIAGLTAAHSGGYLGCARGAGTRDNLQQMLRLEPNKWYLARSAMYVLKLDAESIGVITVGPPRRIWEKFAQELDLACATSGQSEEETERSLADFTSTMWPLAKISLVAVRPNHQGQGHGTRLMRFTLDLLRRDNVDFIYGQYDAGRFDLAHFYSGLGFRNCAPGANLAISGTALVLEGRPDEAFFAFERSAGG